MQHEPASLCSQNCRYRAASTTTSISYNLVLRRTFQGDHNRQMVGNFCVVLSPAELVPQAQRLWDARHGVVETRDACL